MTTYSTSLKLTLPGDGELSGIWGQATNNNLGTLLNLMNIWLRPQACDRQSFNGRISNISNERSKNITLLFFSFCHGSEESKELFIKKHFFRSFQWIQ